MSNLLLFVSVIISLDISTANGQAPLTEFIYPNFKISKLLYPDGGKFLISRNATFAAAISKPHRKSTNNYYFCIIHVASDMIVWSANRNFPMLEVDVLMLCSSGLSIVVASTHPIIWKTPTLRAPVEMMRLLGNGNLVLLENERRTLWQSFDYPTDTILSGQRLPAGSMLRSSISRSDLSEGDYQLQVTKDDMTLTWYGQSYWTMSKDMRPILDGSAKVASLEVNTSGLYLLVDEPLSVAVWLIGHGCSGSLMLAVINSSGRLRLMCFILNQWHEYASKPNDVCRLPLACSTLGLCDMWTGACGCAEPLENTDQGCLPPYGHLQNLMEASCSSTMVVSSVWYMKVGAVNYFGGGKPEEVIQSASECEVICTNNCSSLGFFYTNSSCYLLKDHLVSLFEDTDSDLYLKLTNSSTEKRKNEFRIGHVKLWIPITISLVFLISVVLLIVSVKKRWNQLTILIVYAKKSWNQVTILIDCIKKRWNLVTSHNIELDAFSIPGLPVRFTYEKLLAATNGFSNLIGQGGFGNVYKGTLLINNSTTDVAVKLVKKVSSQDRKIFLTEVAVMANIRHINLVKLHGFCVNKTNKLLVSEFVSRGSLDKVLFGDHYVLNWTERVRITICIAAGLVYLHHSCSPRIIHLDVKPENILLTENFHAKVSDFGLSRLIDSNQSKTFTLMKGTRGYLAPEWLMNDGVSPKTDVYSFGMVLLEIITGRRNTFYEEETGRMVYFPVLAIRVHNRGSYMDMVDRRLQCRVEPDQAERLVKTALCCLHLMPNLRPSMADVVNILGGEMPILEPQFEALRYLKSYELDESLDSIVQQESNVDKMPLFSLQSFSTQELSGPR